MSKPVRTRRRTRRQVQGDLPTAVRVLCGYCRGLLAEIYGFPDQPVWYWSRRVDGGLPAGSRMLAVRWPCREGHNHPVRGERLTDAYLRAVESGQPIVLPNDLRV